MIQRDCCLVSFRGRNLVYRLRRPHARSVGRPRIVKLSSRSNRAGVSRPCIARAERREIIEARRIRRELLRQRNGILLSRSALPQSELLPVYEKEELVCEFRYGSPKVKTILVLHVRGI